MTRADLLARVRFIGGPDVIWAVRLVGLLTDADVGSMASVIDGGAYGDGDDKDSIVLTWIRDDPEKSLMLLTTGSSLIDVEYQSIVASVDRKTTFDLDATDAGGIVAGLFAVYSRAEG